MDGVCMLICNVSAIFLRGWCSVYI